MRRFQNPSSPRGAPTGAGWLAGALAVGLLTLVGVAPAVAQRPSSGSFVLSQSTVNNGGATAVSPTFVLDGSAAQESVVGEAGSTSFALQSGFWTSLSTLNVLRVAAAGSGEGAVGAAGIACTLAAGAVAGDCSEPVTYGTSVSLVADPAAGNRFDGWSGCDSTATTDLPGDTCLVSLNEGRTVTAALTVLGTVGDRVWRDVDGDGVQDAGEPGLDGVTVAITDGAGYADSTVTTGGGLYTFTDVPPGTLAVSVDPSTLPPGVFASFDADGTGTPHEAVITLADGEDLVDADFGYRPVADLALTKVAATDTVSPEGVVVYTLTVTNLGPAHATGIEVTDLLPAGLALVSTSGCAEDPAGAPTCSLGNLPPGGEVSYTLTARPTSEFTTGVVNAATVLAAEGDPNPGNDSDEATTAEAPILEIPALGPSGLALLSMLLGAFGAWRLRRRRVLKRA